MRLIRVNRLFGEVPSSNKAIANKGLPPTAPRGMSEDLTAQNSPESDCNSNHTNYQSQQPLDKNGQSQLDRNGETNASYVSNASSQDVDFIQDNSDYQWFLDFGYRDGPHQHHHPASVLSSLAASYAVQELGYYDDLAKNLDANLAEVDMEDFRTEDIHSILSTLPTMCCGELQTEREGEMFASVSGSMMAKFDFDSSLSPRSSSRGEDSAGSTTDTMSICKSELLFSPVKECPLPSTNFSVDSLDCDLLTEHDIMLTCQANKDNYTIAFEGSVNLYSEDSDYHEAGESEATTSESNNWSSGRFTTRGGRPLIGRGLETSMARSDSVYTTWSKLKKRSSEVQLSRHPSGNNNLCNLPSGVSEGSTLKSQSLPDLFWRRRRELRPLLASVTTATSSLDSPVNQRVVKLFDIQAGSSSLHLSDTNSSVDSRRQISLVKLFMKQKSISNEAMCQAMDQSSASECCCWPSGSQSENSESEPRHVGGNARRNNGGDAGADCLNDCTCPLHDNGNGDVTTDNADWTQHGGGDTEFSTCPFEDSLLVGKCHELIQEEEERESTESESFSKIEESTLDLVLGNSCLSNDLSSNSSQPAMTRLLQFNVNNNNSIERDGALKLSQGTQTRASSVSPVTPPESSSSREEVTRLHRPSPVHRRTPGSLTLHTMAPQTRDTSTQIPVPLMSRSIQTSGNADVKDPRLSPFRPLESPNGTSLVKVIEPSTKKPVYVLYPNYTLPNLEFLRERCKDLNLAKVFLVPQKYATPTSPKKESPVGETRPARTYLGKNRRPFSCNDVEALRKKGFSHVKDWESLTFLLPAEYRQILSEVPEIVQHLKGVDDEVLKPLFCVSPPPAKQQRPVSCDCASLGHITNVSSSSSTATQPSSGYRGSSTILSDSSSNANPPQSTYNPLFVYRYDSISSESGMSVNPVMDRKQPPALPKRSISLPGENPTTPPRPPLPRGILRKSMENNRRNCKLQKNSASSKRYSMFELGTEDLALEGKGKRRSLQGVDLNDYVRRPSLSEKDVDEMEEFRDEGIEGTDSSCEDYNQARPPTPPIPRTPDTDDPCCINEEEEILSLEEFLNLSGLSLMSAEDPNNWDEAEMTKLRSQVSRFLTNKPPQDVNSKKVSFAEKVYVHIRDPADTNQSLHTPPNSPNVSAQPTHRPYQCKLNPTLADMPIREEGESGSDGFSSPPSEGTRVPKIAPAVSLAQRPVPIDLSQKRGLITAVSDAVERIIGHFSAAENQSHCSLLGDSSHTPAVAKLVLTSLCPALYAVMSDGLKSMLDTAFGSIHNSVWQVVEASALQGGPMTKALNELVMRLNGEDVLTEGIMKFNAFVFGLLNVRSLEAWAGYLRTRESVLRKHYSPDGLLLLANTGGASVRGLLDQLLATLQPLSLLPFNLDLLFECRQLHLSLRRMDSVQPSSTSPPPAKQWTLMKLVRSIQSSLTQSQDEENLTARFGRKGMDATTDPPLPDLLDSSSNPRIWEDRQRPRSCVDPTGGNPGSGGFSLVTDIASTMKKRWSGIQLGSKLFQAFDRLGAEDTEEEYTDSLENNPRVNTRKRQPSGSSNNSTSDDNAENIARDSSGSPPENRELQKEEPATGGGKFRRLQMKWEMLSGKDPEEKTSPNGVGLISPIRNSDTAGSNGSGVRSRIPRPVTSPVRTSGIPVLSPQGKTRPSRLTAANKPKISPTGLPPRPMPRPDGETARKEAALRQIPRCDVEAVRKEPVQYRARPSRVDQLHAEQGKAARPSSLPYRPATAPAKGGVQQNRRTELQRRANSSSLGRHKLDNGTPHRWVRTLSHHLPSDSGHLSFNEGERLRVVLEVDSKWLLCCRGDRKGLVPRTAVISIQDNPSSRF